MTTQEKGGEVPSQGSQRSSMHDAELATEDKPLELGEAPDGGLRAWLVAAGGAAIFFCCLGFSNAFGAFQEYYMRHQLRDETPGDIAWIGSLSAFLQFATGMIGGPLFDRFGARVCLSSPPLVVKQSLMLTCQQVIRPAAIAYIFAMMMLSLCATYWQVMLVQGVLMGILMGLLQFPAFAAVSQYFNKKRAAAMGAVVSGSSVGGIIIPIALSKMLNSSSLGFGWSVRVIGFLIIPLLAFASVAIKARLPPRTTSFFIPAAYKEVKYDLLILSLFCMFLGMLTPLFFIPSYAVTRGMDPTLASYLLAILNAASTFGRIIPGVLADKYGRLNILALGGLFTGVINFCMNLPTNSAGLVVYSIAFGFASGTIVSGSSAAFSLIPKDPRDIGTYMGMGMSVSALGCLVGPPVNGVLVDKYGGFFEVSMFSGATCLVGAFIVFVMKGLTPQGFFGKI